MQLFLILWTFLRSTVAEVLFLLLLVEEKCLQKHKVKLRFKHVRTKQGLAGVRS